MTSSAGTRSAHLVEDDFVAQPLAVGPDRHGEQFDRFASGQVQGEHPLGYLPVFGRAQDQVERWRCARRGRPQQLRSGEFESGVATVRGDIDGLSEKRQEVLQTKLFEQGLSTDGGERGSLSSATRIPQHFLQCSKAC